jgi:long-subunit fatty acid transport protein
MRQTGDILPNDPTGSLAYKQDINPQTSFAIILDESTGVNLKYATTADGDSVMLGGTTAKVNTQELKGLVRYQFNDTFAIHGGLRIERTQGSVRLGGLGYGPLAGYQTNFAENTNSGYVLGGSIEIPENALRVALTYNSAIKHDGDTKESIAVGTGVTSVTTPQSINLNMQTGVATNTLFFANIRWVEWSKYLVKPPMVLPEHPLRVIKRLLSWHESASIS